MLVSAAVVKVRPSAAVRRAKALDAVGKLIDETADYGGEVVGALATFLVRSHRAPPEGREFADAMTMDALVGVAQRAISEFSRAMVDTPDRLTEREAVEAEHAARELRRVARALAASAPLVRSLRRRGGAR